MWHQPCVAPRPLARPLPPQLAPHERLLPLLDIAPLPLEMEPGLLVPLVHQCVTKAKHPPLLLLVEQEALPVQVKHDLRRQPQL